MTEQQNVTSESNPSRQAPGRQPSSAGAKVKVYCNLPNGVRIHGDRMVSFTEQTPLGPKDGRVAQRGEDVLIRGTALPRGMDLSELDLPKMIAGYAVTEGVDKDVWDAWFESNKNSAMVRNKCIFAHEQTSHGDGMARDNKGTLHGLEPFKPDTDVRRPVNRNEKRIKITKADDKDPE